jgi:prepilin-type N-terminal cleavage/methylation domain-containing protein
MLRRTPRTSHKGFSLIELIATIAVLAALGSVASTILMTAMRAYNNTAISAQLHDELSMTMERITRELRKIPLNSSGAASSPLITNVTANSINWNNTSSLSVTGTQLMFVDAGAASRPLQNDVTSFAVQCYDESNAALAASLSGSACDAIRRIQISITISRYGVSETLRAKVFVRSTMVGNS